MRARIVPPPIKLAAMGQPSQQEEQIALLQSKQSPGFLIAQRLLAHALDNRPETILLDYSPQGVQVRYQIDGVWMPAPGMDLQTGNVMLAVIKTLAALNPNERRAKQVGKIGIEYRRNKYKPRITSQGTQTGERVLIQFDIDRVVAEKLEDTGMRQKMEEELRGVLREHNGLILFSSPPAHGFTTTFDAAIRSSDRYIKQLGGSGRGQQGERSDRERPRHHLRLRQGRNADDGAPQAAAHLSGRGRRAGAGQHGDGPVDVRAGDGGEPPGDGGHQGQGRRAKRCCAC